MIGLLYFVLAVVALPFKSKLRLEAENAVLRHQLIVLRRTLHGRVRLENHDRWFFIQLYRWFPAILEVLTIIRPETLVRWHRAGFRCYWRWKSQQAKFDDFIECFNNERPHQALNMRYPAERYFPSTRPYSGLPNVDYPFHDRTATVTTCGRICFNRRKINLSAVFAGQNVGIKQVSEQIWLVSFMDYDLGYFDHETCRLEPIENPFGPKVLPMSPV